MNKEYLQLVLIKLEELKEKLYLAYHIKDSRKRDKEVRDIRTTISSFASQLPQDLIAHMESTVGVNALNYQWVDSDIESYISELKKLITNEES